MLILHLFGSRPALEHWAYTQVVTPLRGGLRSISVHGNEARIVFQEAPLTPPVEVRGVVVKDEFDLGDLRGLEPTMVIQDDSFLQRGFSVTHRLYPYIR